MAARENREFVAGEDWIILLNCCDENGAALNLTGGKVEFRIADNTKLVWDLSSPFDIEITAPLTGVALVVVTPAMQAAKGVGAGVLVYEGRALLADGTVTDQAYGNLTVRCSLFNRFP